MARIGTFDDLMAETPEALRPIAAALRALVRSLDPEAVEVVRLGDRAATFGLGPKKMSEGYTFVLPYKEHVNLGFYQGVSLPDPEGRLEGTGARMRHVKLRALEQVQDPALEALILAARAERKAALGR